MIDLRIEDPVNWESIEKLTMEVNRYHWDHWGLVEFALGRTSADFSQAKRAEKR